MGKEEGGMEEGVRMTMKEKGGRMTGQEGGGGALSARQYWIFLTFFRPPMPAMPQMSVARWRWSPAAPS